MFNFRKWLSLTTSLLCLTAVAVKFQNCAPGGNSLDGLPFESEISRDNSDVPNSIIDESRRSTALSFNQKAISVGDAESDITAQGECFEEQNGALLSWALLDPNDDSVLLVGQTGCQEGVFEVAINNLQDFQCGEYMIQARLGLGQAGEVALSIDCE